jgi:hypothetical protein
LGFVLKFSSEFVCLPLVARVISILIWAVLLCICREHLISMVSLFSRNLLV